jgi:hypothetical protein
MKLPDEASRLTTPREVLSDIACLVSSDSNAHGEVIFRNRQTAGGFLDERERDNTAGV